MSNQLVLHFAALESTSDSKVEPIPDTTCRGMWDWHMNPCLGVVDLRSMLAYLYIPGA